MISSSRTVSFQTSGSELLSCNAKQTNITNTIMKDKNSVSMVKMEDASFHADALSFEYSSEKTGMKAADRAPSPKSLLKRFGILKARTKAELSAEVPNRWAIRMFLSNPNNLLVPVQTPTIRLDFINLFVFILQ